MYGMKGRYSTKSKQGIDGVATLTNDALALENKKQSLCKGRYNATRV